jgi:hypothetical protein
MDLTPTGPELLRQDPHHFPRRAGSVRTVKRDARIVYSTTDGDLRKPRDPLLKNAEPTAIASLSGGRAPLAAASP